MPTPLFRLRSYPTGTMSLPFVAPFRGYCFYGASIQENPPMRKRQKIFTNPSDKRTEDYVAGRFG